MKMYHKIQSIFKRDEKNNYKTFLMDQYTRPEFEYLKNNEWIGTEKVDGTNIRIMFDGQLAYGGKSDNAQLHVDLIARLHDLFDGQIDKFAEMFTANDDGHIATCLYGEGYGPGIQKGGGNYIDHKDFVLFDVLINNTWLQRDSVVKIAEEFGVPVVPIIYEGTLDGAIQKTRDGFNSEWGNFLAEGMVLRPKVELMGRNGKRIITKIKNKDFQENR